MQAAHVRINSGKDRPVVALFLMRNNQRLVTHFFRMYKVFFGKRIIFSRRDFLPAFSGEEPVRAGTDVMRYSDWLSNEAMKLTTKLNNSYHTPEEIREILSELTGKEVDETVSLFPPFYTDCGKNISFGRRGGDERCTGKYGCGWNAG